MRAGVAAQSFGEGCRGNRPKGNADDSITEREVETKVFDCGATGAC